MTRDSLVGGRRAHGRGPRLTQAPPAQSSRMQPRPRARAEVDTRQIDCRQKRLQIKAITARAIFAGDLGCDQARYSLTLGVSEPNFPVSRPIPESDPYQSQQSHNSRGSQT